MAEPDQADERARRTRRAQDAAVAQVRRLDKHLLVVMPAPGLQVLDQPGRLSPCRGHSVDAGVRLADGHRHACRLELGPPAGRVVLLRNEQMDLVRRQRQQWQDASTLQAARGALRERLSLGKPVTRQRVRLIEHRGVVGREEAHMGRTIQDEPMHVPSQHGADQNVRVEDDRAPRHCLIPDQAALERAVVLRRCAAPAWRTALNSVATSSTSTDLAASCRSLTCRRRTKGTRCGWCY